MLRNFCWYRDTLLCLFNTLHIKCYDLSIVKIARIASQSIKTIFSACKWFYVIVCSDLLSVFFLRAKNQFMLVQKQCGSDVNHYYWLVKLHYTTNVVGSDNSIVFVDWLQLIDWSQGMLASCRNYEDGKDADVSCLLVLTQLPSWGWLTGERISLNTPTAGGDDDAALSEWALTTSECSVSVWWADTALLSRLCNLFTYYQHISVQLTNLLNVTFSASMCPLYPILDHL